MIYFVGCISVYPPEVFTHRVKRLTRRLLVVVVLGSVAGLIRSLR